MSDIIQKIRDDLDYRTSTGKPLGHVVLERAMAEQLIRDWDQATSPAQQQQEKS